MHRSLAQGRPWYWEGCTLWEFRKSLGGRCGDSPGFLDPFGFSPAGAPCSLRLGPGSGFQGGASPGTHSRLATETLHLGGEPPQGNAHISGRSPHPHPHHLGERDAELDRTGPLATPFERVMPNSVWAPKGLGRASPKGKAIRAGALSGRLSRSSK